MQAYKITIPQVSGTADVKIDGANVTVNITGPHMSIRWAGK